MDNSTDIMKKLKPSLDAFMKEHIKDDMTNNLRIKLTKLIDTVLVGMGYNDRLVRLVEPEPNGNTTILVFTRDEQDKKDKKFTVTTISVRGKVTPEELQ